MITGKRTNDSIFIINSRLKPAREESAPADQVAAGLDKNRSDIVTIKL